MSLKIKSILKMVLQDAKTEICIRSRVLGGQEGLSYGDDP